MVVEGDNMDKVSVWEFHETIKGYSGLDCYKAETVGGEIIVVLEDLLRESVPDAGLFENKSHAKHRYTIRFSGGVLSMRIWHSHTINFKISEWIEQGFIPWSCCASFKLRESEFIDWTVKTQFFDDDLRHDLVHYCFVMLDDWVIEVVDDREPTVEVEYL